VFRALKVAAEGEVLVADDDATLVERCKSGDEASMRRLVERFQGSVFGLCFRMLGHREDAEDVAQDVFVRTFRSLHTWDSARPFKPWLLTIAANRCRTALVKRNRRPAPTEFVSNEASLDTHEETGALGEELQLALEQLREEYRVCIVLFHQQELSLAEVSEVLDRPPGTVKTWLHRARRELAEFLQRRGVVPDARFELHEV
jgi:RNA polymerase sigma-70 factor (ECF subfamily)